MTDLENYIHASFNVDSNFTSRLAQLFEQESLLKSEYYCKVDRPCSKLSFLKSGYIRVFKYLEGKDVTQWVVSEGEMITDLSGLIFHTPARWNMQALTDCELYTISQKKYDSIKDVIPNWDTVE